MRKSLMKINALPLKWRLTVWTSLWMCVFFLLYNSAQYLVLDRWILIQDRNAIRTSMDEIQGYYADNVSRDVLGSKKFLEKANQRDQLIRILDRDGKVMLSISDDLPEKWVKPESVNRTMLVRTWHEKDHLLVMRSPLTVGSFKGTIELIRNMENYERLNQILLVIMALGALGGITFSMFGGILLARQFVKPIAGLSETMRKIKHGGLTERVEFVDNKDELSKLSQVFNEMMDRLEASFQQQNQFVEDASHELRTPIAIIEGHLTLLARWGKNDPSVLEESLKASLEELSRLKNLTQDLLASSLGESGQTESEGSNPAMIIRKVVDDFAVIHPGFTFETNFRLPDGIHLAITEHHLKQILMIVLDNAIKYSGQQKKVVITTKKSGNNEAQLEIADNGVGIAADHIPHVFDRFYRVDKARSRKMGGSGLGLAIAKRLVEDYRGTITLASAERQGTVVTISLPIVMDSQRFLI
ncbi:sensor histidine kinase [Cohnella silvisoli]|uniref:Signal transduction histidine-protein kinase ArlS n=1 Tax=Cohnella silvisoli TaxID=2873699 RepID=A0ABV1KTX8_9BACL|nr:HAMP domain-containing histidine kinase [Cohnella silvisoli]MCD9022778.1 HAMP domain-containing histidine kinase [Cohnella silvisoli]